MIILGFTKDMKAHALQYFNIGLFFIVTGSEIIKEPAMPAPL